MSRYPSAVWKPIRDTSTVAVRKDILCLHTAVGSASGTWSYFDRLDVGVYSHGVIGGIWGGDAGKNLDGVAWQMADTDYRAAANLNGNPRVIAWETADNAVRPIAPWTPLQCDTIVRVMVDAHRLDSIPLLMIPDSLPGRRGVAYHRLGCDPYRITGGELWSLAYGKDCPTDPRIKQLPGLVERAVNIVNGGTDVEDDMDAAQDAKLTAIDAGVRSLLSQFDPAKANSLIDKLNRTGTRLADVQTALTAGIADDAARDARILGRLDALSLPSFTAPQIAELAAALDLDEDAVAAAVRRDLGEALSGPVA